jgi:hypothetical protein
VSRSQRNAKSTTQPRTGIFATLRAALPGRGTGAPSSRRAPIALLAALAVIASLALTAAPASAAPPSTQMGAISKVSYASAHVEGKLTSSPDGAMFYTTIYEFQYSTDENTWIPGFSKTIEGTVTNKKVEGDIQGLKGGTKYFVRLIANGGFFFPNPPDAEAVSPTPNPNFTTLAVEPPSVIATDNASDLAYTTATVKGKVSRPANADPAFDVGCHFQYVTDEQFQATGFTDSPGDVLCEGANPIKAPGASDVEAHLTGLAPNTAYHLRIFVSNASPTTDAKEAPATFTTLTVDPPSVISIDNATDVEYTQAQVEGVVERSANADPAFDVNCNFEYVTDEQFNLNPPGEEFAGATPVGCEGETPIHAEGEADVKAKLSGLVPSTTYHLRLTASNQGGADSREAAATFTTQGPIPKPAVIATDNATDVAPHEVTVKGEVQRPAGNDPALNIECRFEYVTDADFTASGFTGAPAAPCTENPITADTADGVGKQKVNGQLGGLKPATTYHLRLAAENGGGIDIKDATSIFITAPAELPTVTIDPVADGTYTTAHVSGTVTIDDPGQSNAYVYIEKSADGGVTWDREAIPNVSPGAIVVEKNFTGLQPSTTYFFRIRSTYSGDSYENTEANGEFAQSPEPNPSITTEPLVPPTAEDLEVSGVTATTAHFSATVDPHAPAGPLSELGKKAFAIHWEFVCAPVCQDVNGNPIEGTAEAEDGAQTVAGDAKRLDPNTPYEVMLVLHSDGGGDTETVPFNTPLIKPTIKAAAGASDGKGGYTLQGIVNPNGSNVTNCKFEWGPNSADYAFTADCSPMPTGRNEVQSITIFANGGQFKLTYRGQTTADLPFDAGAAEIQAALEALPLIGPGSVAVAGRTVTFQDSLDQLDVPQIMIQNGTVPLFSNNPGGEPVVKSTSTLVQGGNSSAVTVEAHLTSLNPGVVYHYNLLATNGAGQTESGDQEFTPTLSPDESCPNEQARKENNSLALPECRAYEVVTPSGKEGFDARLLSFNGGDGVVYSSSAGNIAKSGQNSPGGNRYVAVRTATGWDTIPNLNGSSGSLKDAPSYVTGPGAFPVIYSEDLLSSLWEINRIGGPAGSNVYRRNPDGTFTFIAPPHGAAGAGIASSADLSHVVRWTLPNGGALDWGPGVYEFVGTGNTEPRRVDIDNSGAPITACRYSTQDQKGRNADAVFNSRDGRVLVVRAAGGCGGTNPASNEVWARIDGTTSIDVSAPQCDRTAADPGGLCNGPVGGGGCGTNADANESGPGCRGARFEGAAKDGSRVFFTTTRQLLDADVDQTTDLYACDIPAGTPAPVDKANHCAALRQVSGGASAPGAEVESVVATSDNGTTAVFTAAGVLADDEDALKEKAVAGDQNLYVWRADTAHPNGQITFVGRFYADKCPGPDMNDPTPVDCPPSVRTTPDGRYLVVNTASQLLDTDTDDARDVYRFDVGTGELTRASTNVFGVAGNGSGFDASVSALGGVSQAVSDDGQKIVFTTTEALSSADGNGEPDIYLWTPSRVSLISAGAVGNAAITGEGFPGRFSISGSGRDIYFETPGALTPADGDDIGDVYDVRVGGGFSLAPATPCSGEACQAASSGPPVVPAPATTQPPADPGNVKPKTCPKGKVVKGSKCVKKPKKHSGKKHHGKKAAPKRGGGK